MKNPAFLFYPGDYLVDTMTFDLEQHGGYLLCLIHQFKSGHFSEKEGMRIAGKTWSTIKCKFEVDNAGLFFNERLDIEKEKRTSYCESRGKNRKHTKNTRKSYVKHMGNGNGNGNTNEISEPVVSSESSEVRGGVGEKDLTHPDDIPSEPPKEVESKQKVIKYMLEVLRLDLYQIEKLIEQYGVDYTLEKIELTRKNIRSIKNPVQYFVAAMKSNYVDTDQKAKTEAEALAADRAKRDQEWLTAVKAHLDAGKTIKPETFDKLPADLQAQLVYDQEHYKKSLEWRYIHSKFRPDLVQAAEGDK